MSRPNFMWVSEQFTMTRDTSNFNRSFHRGIWQVNSCLCPSIHLFITWNPRVTRYILERQMVTIDMLPN